MTSLTMSMDSKAPSITKTDKCLNGKIKMSKSLKSFPNVVPMSVINEKYESGKSSTSTTTTTTTKKDTEASNMAMTATLTTANNKTKNYFSSLRKREHKQILEGNNNKLLFNTHNGQNVRGQHSEGNIDVEVVQRFSHQDLDENLVTGDGSRAKNVIKESHLKNATGNNLKKDISTINNKTDTSDQNEKVLDTGTKLDEALPEANGCEFEVLEENINEITLIESAEAQSDDLKSTATAGTPVTRPVTLATGGNGFSCATQTSPPFAKTIPKTPNSSPQQLEASQNKSELHHNISVRKTHQKSTPKTPPVTPDSPATYLDDDLDSIYSFATTTSGRSTMSCEHSYVAHNGTTFSGRKNKFVIHNSQYAGLVGTAYVTPTQRAQNQIRKLKALLHAMQQDINQKNDEILRLTREVAELRLFKASLNSPEELNSASSDAVTVREAELLQTSQDVSPIVDMVDDTSKSSPNHHNHHHRKSVSNNYHQESFLQQQQNAMHSSSDMQSSFADSGHFEDMTSSISVHSKDSYVGNICSGHAEIIEDENTGKAARNHDDDGGGGGVANAVAAAERAVEVQRQELIRMYEQRIEDLIRNQDTASTEMKRIHNDKVEALLQKLSECNTRYADIVPDYEMAKERIRELENQLEDLQHKLIEHEEKQNKMYLHMYQKGQEAERIARADQALELAYRAPTNRVSINELLHQLQSTQEELENIRAAECRNECGSNHALLTAKEAISLWVLGARKTIYRRLLEAQKNHTQVDPEVTLQFLKSAVYYFLTDKENSQGHLQAIESILDFTEAEKQNINKARAAK